MFQIGNYKVKIVTGKKTQTINVFNTKGERCYKFRISDSKRFVNQNLLQGHTSIQKMQQNLIKEHNAVIEKSCNGTEAGLDSWMQESIFYVEQAINNLLEHFVQVPYFHRVEQSLHCELFRHLLQSDPLNQVLNFEHFQTGIIHKEWPETIPREYEGKNQRGNFDFALLTPPSKKEQKITTDDFCKGLIRPSIVIEMGLNYDFKHLQNDHQKLINSGVDYGYLIHFARKNAGQKNVKEYVEQIISKEKASNIKIAYAHVVKNNVCYRRIGDKMVKC
ncbi:hypothetical protein [Candidatus Uabimicrobium amorphum]|uniref:Uncharacterized protein n=1 Tax=Uabimicrobium amorphum TaxID=2596890 RepID=A0A5S9ISP9_UABAM|nr:hypothetical protein [Candidatus Uabimicrobium amorphum]BBM86841.1 hypothetical protein UABAM_05238 [Candidatus Uabimicrobium amorphum]